jgi:hypothetical protein
MISRQRTTASLLMIILLAFGSASSRAAESFPVFAKTDRGLRVETDRYEVKFENGVIVRLFNKLTDEEYLDPQANLESILPHLPSGLGTQNGEPAREAAERLNTKPWWEHPADMRLPNQHYADAQSTFEPKEVGEGNWRLEYKNLTDGENRYPDEEFAVLVGLDKATGDLLVTPEGRSPRPGVYAASLVFGALAPEITAEAPICDGVRISRTNTGRVLWTNKWPDFWDFAFLAFNGRNRGAFAVWTEDEKVRFYKSLYYLNNSEGLSFSFAMMNVPPFEKLKSCVSPLPWRIQAFDRSWMQGVDRYHAWRDANRKIPARPDFVKNISFLAVTPNAQKRWLDQFMAYTSPWQDRAAAFLASIRVAGFDNDHSNNTPMPGFKEETVLWREAGPYGMAYLQPMIMWSPKPKDERQKAGADLAKQATTRSVFLKGPDDIARFVDQNHLGHPGWQRWFLDWVKEWSQDYGAQGIYHDQSYLAPMDRRGDAINDMTSPQGMDDYFRKVIEENPGTFHGSEKTTEANIIGVSFGIGSGYHWGSAPYMRLARANDASAISAALAAPHSVIWSFINMRNDSTWEFRDRWMAERRAQIAGMHNSILGLDPKVFPLLANVPWHDRTRDVTFLKFGLRPVFPSDYSRDVFSYFEGKKGERFEYQRTPYGSRFAQVFPGGKTPDVIYGIAHGVRHANIGQGGITGWVFYNAADASVSWNEPGVAGLDPRRFYLINPTLGRPSAWISTANEYGPSLYESSVSDSGYNDSFLFFRIQAESDLRRVSGSESMILHSAVPPLAIFVNGKIVPARPGKLPDTYLINTATPADVAVILKKPETDQLAKSTLGRLTESISATDLLEPSLISPMVDGGKSKLGRQVLTMPARLYGSSISRLYVPISVPAGGSSGVWRAHLPGKKGASVDTVELNLRPYFSRQEGAANPDFVDIPLAGNEVKLVSFASTPAPSLGVEMEWIEQSNTYSPTK